VAAVFAQVHGDAVGARFFGVQRGLDRVRVTGAPGLAQGGDVVDVESPTAHREAETAKAHRG